jgi:aliphatic nitrilase
MFLAAEKMISLRYVGKNLVNVSENFKVAAVQAAPVYYDLEASLAKAIGLIETASQQGCSLIAFGEAWLPGYPFHIWLGSPAWTLQYTIPYFDNSLDLESDEFKALMRAAKGSSVAVSMGYSERSGGSLYLGQCLISAEGELEYARRKLKPTHVERTVFGEGYGNDLVVTDTDLGKIGMLCCWEHIQPLSKYALYSQNEQVHISAWPAFSLYPEMAYALGKQVNMAASQIYAVEGQCYVIAATSVVTQACLDMLDAENQGPGLLNLGGGSAMIFAPDGRECAEYLSETEEGLVVAEIDLNAIKMAKAIADPAGHYAKPEATRLVHDREPYKAVEKPSLTTSAFGTASTLELENQNIPELDENLSKS